MVRESELHVHLSGFQSMVLAFSNFRLKIMGFVVSEGVLGLLSRSACSFGVVHRVAEIGQDRASYLSPNAAAFVFLLSGPKALSPLPSRVAA